MKRVLAIGDLHCGHVTGLTPSAWITGGKGREKIAETQLIMWEFFSSVVESLRPIDILFINGDAIDGKGGRNGGTEQEPDLNRQAEMAVDVINFISPNHTVMTRGTPYHVSTCDGLPVEDLIAKEVGATIGGHEWVDVSGLVFDLKHKIGSSTIPHGRATALKKEALWNQLWSEREANPKADIILRSHVHYHEYAGNRDYLAMTLPCLQWGTKYGIEQCSGTIDFGCVHFDVSEDGSYSWASHILPTVTKQEAIKL